MYKKKITRGFWFQGPYVDPDADPPWRLDSFAFSRGFLWKNWFCFGFLFRVMYSVDTFLHRDVLLSYIKLISTCDLMRRGVAWGGLEEPVWEEVVLGRLGGCYYITVLYGKPIINGHSKQTLIAFLNHSSLQPQNGDSRSADWHRRRPGGRRQSAALAIVSNKTIQPDWLKTKLDSGRRRGEMCLQKNGSRKMYPAVSLGTFWSIFPYFPLLFLLLLLLCLLLLLPPFRLLPLLFLLFFFTALFLPRICYCRWR